VRRSDRSGAMAESGTWQPLGRDQLAMRVAQDIPEGWSVNLGIGIPTLVGNYVPAEREVVFHSENGILGMGPAPPPDQVNPWLVNASRQHVTLRSGGSFMSHSDSFALVRGGHLDLCVLGAFQVAENGDLANWARSEDESAPAIGGAMDLAVGARRIWIVMEHNTRSGEARLLRRCTYPLTAKACVLRVYTELAVIDVTPRGFAVVDMVPGLSLDELQARTDAPLRRAS
jgi:3-oxoadipate CoA-transferase beta subunit